MGRIGTLFAAIAHGDDEHRAWLKEAIDCHFSGRPVPAAFGQGTKEKMAALIEEQRKALAKLVNEVNGLEWRQGQVIEVIGQTNWSVLQEAANRARRLTAP